MATATASKRLAKEYALMQKDPPPFCFGRPLESDVLTWHFILRGPPDTPYQDGEYWGQLMFPPDYPFKPPGIKMTTPSGRFVEGQKICTSMSDFHPGSWNPAWSVANILIGLHSFMNADEISAGAMKASSEERKKLAAQSHAWNVSQRQFLKVFPEYATDKAHAKDLPNMGKGAAASGSSSSSKTKASSSSATASPLQPRLQPNDPQLPPLQASSDEPPAPAAQVAPPVVPPAPMSTRSKIALVLAILASLFVGRVISRIGAGEGSVNGGGGLRSG